MNKRSKKGNNVHHRGMKYGMPDYRRPRWRWVKKAVKQDMSSKCNRDDDDRRNPCRHCTYFCFPIGCMMYEVDYERRKARREKRERRHRVITLCLICGTCLIGWLFMMYIVWRVYK